MDDNTNTEESPSLEFETDVLYTGGMRFVKDNVTGPMAFYGLPSFKKPFEMWKQIKALGGFGMGMETRDLVLKDARVRSLNYAKTGFCLQPIELEPAVTDDWSKSAQMETPENSLYKEALIKILETLHPTVKKIEFFAFLIRGGENSQNAPSSNAPHLDMFQDRTMANDFVKEHTPASEESKEDKVEDIDEDQDNIVVGMWLPLQTENPVYDHPLCFVDASTFSKDDEIPNKTVFSHVEADGTKTDIINLSSLPKFNSTQDWYYYHQQTHQEVVIFRHYTKSTYLANIHASVDLPLPKGAATRKSVECRAQLFF
jgi:hypothetical protein